MTTKVVDPSQPVDYCSTVVPSSYTCCECGKTGVKLWRRSHEFLENQSLKCVDCSGAEQRRDVSGMDGTGSMIADDRIPTDNIGWRVPAVPTLANDSFWKYSSVPQVGCDWWIRLPLR